MSTLNEYIYKRFKSNYKKIYSVNSPLECSVVEMTAAETTAELGSLSKSHEFHELLYV